MLKRPASVVFERNRFLTIGENGYHPQDFTGGINRKDGVDKLADSEYPLGINLRVRANNVAPIKKAAKLTGINAALFKAL